MDLFTAFRKVEILVTNPHDTHRRQIAAVAAVGKNLCQLAEYKGLGDALARTGGIKLSVAEFQGTRGHNWRPRRHVQGIRVTSNYDMLAKPESAALAAITLSKHIRLPVELHHSRHTHLIMPNENLDRSFARIFPDMPEDARKGYLASARPMKWLSGVAARSGQTNSR